MVDSESWTGGIITEQSGGGVGSPRARESKAGWIERDVLGDFSFGGAGAHNQGTGIPLRRTVIKLTLKYFWRGLRRCLQVRGSGST